MKKILTILLFTLFSSILFAQSQITVKSFRKLENDMTARYEAPKKDQNGDVCAVIKVVTTQTGFNWDSDGLGIIAAVPKVSEYWIYVPWGAKRLTIKHPQLGMLRDYLYPMTIEKATVYELTLSTGKVVTTVEDEVIGQWLVINPEPTEAMVYLNDKLVKTGSYQAKLKPGKYSYRVEAPMYHSEVGFVEIANARKELSVKLKPAFGSISVNTDPEKDAKVLIDGKLQPNVTPCQSEPLTAGDHIVQVLKDLYEPVNQKVTVVEGQTVPINLTMVPNFAELDVTLPENATLFINNEQKATGNWKGRLSAGVYSLEARLDKYKPAKQDIELTVGDNKSVALTPSPIEGSLDVIATPSGATISINGKEYGTTPYTFDKLLIGEYSVQLTKTGYATVNKTVTIEEGKNTELKETLTRVAAPKVEKEKKEQPIVTENKEQKDVQPVQPVQPVAKNYSPTYYKYKKSKTLWLVSALVTGAAGTFAYLQAGTVYKQYQTATTNDASNLYSKVKLYDMVSPVAFGLAGFSAIEFILKSGKQSKAKKQSVSFNPVPLKNGGGFVLAYHF
jgi:hypothetical protein